MGDCYIDEDCSECEECIDGDCVPVVIGMDYNGFDCCNGQPYDPSCEQCEESLKLIDKPNNAMDIRLYPDVISISRYLEKFE